MSGIDAPIDPGLGSPTWGGFDQSRTRGRGAADIRRSFGTAARLGWQMEANWTDPVLFFIYSVAKPLASALILVVMLDVISGGAKPEYRAFVVIGSARCGPWSLPGSPGWPGASSRTASAIGC
jgi:hypothetical protein